MGAVFPPEVFGSRTGHQIEVGSAAEASTSHHLSPHRASAEYSIRAEDLERQSTRGVKAN